MNFEKPITPAGATGRLPDGLPPRQDRAAEALTTVMTREALDYPA
jgi:hypothetical protein